MGVIAHRLSFSIHLAIVALTVYSLKFINKSWKKQQHCACVHFERKTNRMKSNIEYKQQYTTRKYLYCGRKASHFLFINIFQEEKGREKNCIKQNWTRSVSFPFAIHKSNSILKIQFWKYVFFFGAHFHYKLANTFVIWTCTVCLVFCHGSFSFSQFVFWMIWFQLRISSLMDSTDLQINRMHFKIISNQSAIDQFKNKRSEQIRPKTWLILCRSTLITQFHSLKTTAKTWK